ncbi:hypothetical protein M404DRAFT_991485 [Pisolithus tinctorius Marx 270]|uniref:Uncharacterized protein n=1 Tax=Pisolithus tinctorius Marx 270 TaxID=870435 RepID=A0A0C3PZB7_PISTI|nr:hypothetical protein M404DRAFT_991485 [Pisolithus tinctorius Marx 270]
MAMPVGRALSALPVAKGVVSVESIVTCMLMSFTVSHARATLQDKGNCDRYI